MSEKKYPKDRLEKSRTLFLEPRVNTGLELALKNVEDKNFSRVVGIIANIDSVVEHHIINNCAKALEEKDRIDCISKANDLKIDALNRIAEKLTEQCGGDMEYLD